MAVSLFGEEGFHDVLPPLVDAVGDGAFQLDYRVFGFGNVHDRQTEFVCSLFVSAIIRCCISKSFTIFYLGTDTEAGTISEFCKLLMRSFFKKAVPHFREIACFIRIDLNTCNRESTLFLNFNLHSLTSVDG